MFTNLAGRFWKAAPAQLRRWMTRRLHTTFTISAAAIITNERGEVLLLEHVLRSSVSGWGVPGGFIKKGEQPEIALRREIMEETGLELSDVRIFSCRTIYRHVEIIMVAKGRGEASIKSREITDLGWYPIDEMPREMSPDQKSLVKNVLERTV